MHGESGRRKNSSVELTLAMTRSGAPDLIDKMSPRPIGAVHELVSHTRGRAAANHMREVTGSTGNLEAVRGTRPIMLEKPVLVTHWLERR